MAADKDHVLPNASFALIGLLAEYRDHRGGEGNCDSKIQKEKSFYKDNLGKRHFDIF